MRSSKIKIYLSICCLVLVVLSCSAPAIQRTTPTPVAPATSEEPAVTTPPEQPPAQTPTAEVTDVQGIALDPSEVYLGKFAKYSQTEVSLPAQFSGGYSLPVNLDQVEIHPAISLTDPQKAALSANGFVVAQPEYPSDQIFTEFYQGYEVTRYDDAPVFITTDAVFHVYHLVFDKMLRDLERTYFIPTLEELTSTMLAASAAQYQQLRGGPLEEAAMRNVAFFSVAAALLQTGDSVLPEAQPLVDAEVALINGGGGVAISPIWQHEGQAPDLVLREDYSQYIPRGHYTLSPELEKYFRAMMWFGRMTFRLKDTQEIQRSLLITQAARQAVSANGNPALVLWQQIYDPTVFIVGKADDLGIYEYGAVSDAVFGPNPDLASFADPSLLQVFLATARQLPAPQVNSMWVWIWQDQDDVTQGFRFMGQRFTLDQYVFGQVMWRNVGTMSEPRDLPKALDFFAAQGSELALTLLREMGEDKYANYETQMAKVTQEVAQLGLDSWTQNLYWSWLYALQPVFAPKGPAFPAFMQTDAWARKDLQTALSSWTELKHDTILYSKQVMAEMGGGPGEPPPHGYVEPNPEAYARLLSLVEMTYSGLSSRGILDLNTQTNLNNLQNELAFFLDISQRELTGSAISEDEYWRMKYFGGWLEMMTIASADSTGEIGSRGYLEDQKSPVVADVATGIDRVLEEAVGYPTRIYVVLPDAPYRVGVGMVYTYYEFAVPSSQRLTDEAWRGMLEAGTAPAQPDWTKAFIVK